MRSFAWACVFLAAVLALIAAAAGLILFPVVLALTYGNATVLLLILLGVPATVASAFGASAACGRAMGYR